MSVDPEDLTVSGLPRSPLPGGIKAEAVADLLRRGGWDYRTAIRQTRALSKTVNEQARHIEQLEAEIASLQADGATRTGPGVEQIGEALLAATRAGEQITAEARVSADRITSEAETRAAAILEQATTAAEQHERASIEVRESLDKEQAAARTELARERERLERDEEASRQSLERERTRVLGEAQETAETILAGARREVEQLESSSEQMSALLADSRRRVESALRQLQDVDANSSSRHADLLDDLRPPDSEPSSSPAVED